jgi:hypothetical protein
MWVALYTHISRIPAKMVAAYRRYATTRFGFSVANSGGLPPATAEVLLLPAMSAC